MFGQIEEMQKNLQAKLETIIVEGQAGDGLIKVKANGNRKIQNIEVDPSLVKDGDSEELEDLLLVAINRALDIAETRAAEETQSLMSSILPPGMNLPGLF